MLKSISLNDIARLADYYFDENMLQNICEEGRYSYYTDTANSAWTTKSWNIGCSQYKLGYKH